MPSTYSSLKIQLMATGENSTTWGSITNVNLGTAIEEAIVGSADVTFASNNQTLTLTDSNNSQPARNVRLNLVGTTGGTTRNLVVPSIEKPYIVNNGCADSVVVKTAAGTGITVPAGKTMWVYNDGTNVVDAVTHLSGLNLNTALPVASGGTGATTASDARTALGAAASGTNTDITTLNPTGGLLIGSPTGGAQGTGTINAAGLFVNGVAVGVGSGSVTSVNATSTVSGLSFSGGPITTSGTLTLSGTLGVSSGGTGVTTSTGTGSVVLSTSPTISKAVLNDGYTEEVFAITDGTTVTLDPNNGSIQTWVLGANRTPGQANWAAGQSITLMIDDGTAYTITWTTLGVVWETDGGSAPTLDTTGYTTIVLWKVGTTIYGARVGVA